MTLLSPQSVYIADYAGRIAAQFRIDKIPPKMSPADAAELCTRYSVYTVPDWPDEVTIAEIAKHIATTVLRRAELRARG